MAQTKQQIQAILSSASAHPRHRFGQNFMIDGNLVRLVADAGQIVPGDLVIEVGPGTGTLTDELLDRGADLIAVEIDRDLAALLGTRLQANPHFRLIQADALHGKHALNPELGQAVVDAKAQARAVRLVANLPYNIASPLVVELLIAGVDVLAFTVQKEVADRMKAQPDTDDFGPLTIMIQLLSAVEILRTLPPQAFWPMPKIDSALVRLTRADQLGPSARPFSDFVHKVFSSRRKTLRNALIRAEVEADAILSATNIEGSLRPEQISPSDYWRMFQCINKMS